MPKLISSLFVHCIFWSNIALAQAGDERTQSGYEKLPEFGGPESVVPRLKTNDVERESRYQFNNMQNLWAPYFDWKRRVLDDYGVAFGTSFYLLYQHADSSLQGEEGDALGSIFRYQGSWTIFGRQTGNPGRIEWRLEHRANMGGFQSPSQLSNAIGIGALTTAFAYSENFDLDLAVINWTQEFNEQTAGFALGRLAFDAYLDAFPFQSLSRGFINRSFILNPTMAVTGTGALGAVVKGFVSDSVWLGAQLHDANAISGDFDLDTMQEGEWLKAVEIGFTPSFMQRKTQLIQLTYWQKDARQIAGTSKGKGWVVSAAHQLNDRIFPFVRFGHSDGGAGVAAEDSVSMGFQLTGDRERVVSIGLGWAKPAERYGSDVDDEIVFEASWKMQLSKNFSLTPDAQLIFNPMSNPDENSVWVLGLRGIITL